jgi:uncharacterized membrane protein YfcA
MNITVILAAFLSGIIGAMGLGGGGVLLIFLTLFASVPQMKAQGINLLFFIPVGVLATIIYSFKKQIEWKIVFKMWLGGIVGVVLGFLFAKQIGTDVLSYIFGVFLIVLGLSGLFSKHTKKYLNVMRNNRIGKGETKNERKC